MMRFNRPIAALFLGTCLAAGRAGWGAEILLLSRFPPPGPNYAWPDDPLVRLLEAQGHQVDTSFMGVSLGSLHFNRPLIDAVNGADVIVVSPAAPIAIHANYADACAVSSSGSVSEVDFSLIPHVARPILRMDTYSGSNLPLTSQSRTDVVIHDPDHPFVAQFGITARRDRTSRNSSPRTINVFC